MSKLRQNVLEQIRIMGNNSGCHQMPERSFFYKGKQFPVCARCTGVAIGQVAAIIAFLFKVQIKALHCIVLLSIMGFDWFVQEINLVRSTNIRRLITGICGGFGLFSLYILILKKIIKYVKSKT